MHFFRRYAVILPLIATISLLFVSCGESKVSQCQKIVKVANQAVNDAKAITNGGQTNNPDAMLKAADTMDKAAQEMQAIKLSDDKLKEYQAGFIKMYRDLGSATRSFVTALKNKDRPAVDATLKNLNQAIVPEPNLVNGLNNYCDAK